MNDCSKTHPNPDPLRSALEFYADGKRYGGPNQRRVDDDPYTHPDASYMKDVTRDGGDIARRALASAPRVWRTGLGDIVSVRDGTPYHHDWRGVKMKIVSLRVDPDGKYWASVIDNDDAKNTRHRGFGVYDGETTDFELDHLEKVPAPPSPSLQKTQTSPAPPAVESGP